jgi:hypothetical protein
MSVWSRGSLRVLAREPIQAAAYVLVARLRPATRYVPRIVSDNDPRARDVS